MSARRLLRLIVVIGAGLSGAMLAACVAPALSYGAYEGKAAASAESSLAAARTAILAARTADLGRLPGTYLAVVAEQAEGNATSVEGQFSSIQPPDGRADGLRDQLRPLLASAAELLELVRIHARRGELDALGSVIARLAPVADALERFAEAHS